MQNNKIQNKLLASHDLKARKLKVHHVTFVLLRQRSLYSRPRFSLGAL